MCIPGTKPIRIGEVKKNSKILRIMKFSLSQPKRKAKSQKFKSGSPT
jgi:hypothetical protein